MKKEKMLVKRKSTDNWSFKQIMIFGFAIIVLASIIFMQADNASAAKKKKQTQEYVSIISSANLLEQIQYSIIISSSARASAASKTAHRLSMSCSFRVPSKA